MLCPKKKKEYVLEVMEIIKSQPYVDGSQESKVLPFEWAGQRNYSFLPITEAPANNFHE